MEAVILLLLGAVVLAAVVGVLSLLGGLLTLTFKLLPLLLIGYVAVRVVRRLERRSTALTTSDSGWLDTRR